MIVPVQKKTSSNVETTATRIPVTPTAPVPTAPHDPLKGSYSGGRPIPQGGLHD
jgi:hypothetical protein